VTIKLRLTALLALAAVGRMLATADVPAKPNIIFLLADDLRWDALEMKNLAADPAHQGRLRHLREQHQQFAATLK
jgi:arylsulfatase A-like enzyme